MVCLNSWVHATCDLFTHAQTDGLQRADEQHPFIFIQFLQVFLRTLVLSDTDNSKIVTTRHLTRRQPSYWLIAHRGAHHWGPLWVTGRIHLFLCLKSDPLFYNLLLVMGTILSFIPLLSSVLSNSLNFTIFICVHWNNPWNAFQETHQLAIPLVGEHQEKKPLQIIEIPRRHPLNYHGKFTSR